ncbi:phosphate acyltransferase PlsX [Chromobacterium piscinae]|uniref:Phosphate acyltransferase n=1 Tax=Chromobacterium piscinae TaxID=686831 RepID=A0ABV0H0L9_9NEIS|nr:phosphate acyltransferase PlsX [Chromobacterium piscinae]MBX9295431.1 phosphate acyltransferase PlsX [Chromobacterium vaccinii]MBX9346573.1 phosphate acyltransferase PlsX [Chromobacterium vaccinii]MBX9356300.1 phosphate acyltransferase PlsX [Chromobacterium vaccinii]MCD4505831.1 phosphate acyltransferase PlsX [Chromobacterium piscinae]MCD5326348.1 phosphate acyltransferase PlsX [Chromobacterium piscinae]
MTITVAVDAMGGDVGLKVTVPASIQFLQDHPDIHLILVGDQPALEAELALHDGAVRERILIQHATQVVGMDEAPQLALKNKKDSSMRVAINLVKEGRAQAAVSAGNTGALMATARFVLKTIPGIDRPAIAKLLPNVKGTSCVLDLGANVDCTPEQLLQFGIMGSELMACLQGKANPSVGLLNIGSEDIKGNDNIKKTAELLRQSELNFYGNVEGDDICKGTTDVVVCDGFTGNVALKTAEGLAHMFAVFLKEEFGRSWWTRLCALAALPVLGLFKKRIDPRRYNGASLLGLRGIVVKSHGGADVTGFRYALAQACEEAGSDVIAHIADRVAKQLDNLKQSEAEAN